MARKDRDMPDAARTPASFSTVDEQTKAQAMRAQQPAPALTRAQQVTAARLASSPLAQEAARTTEVLKRFTAKGGLLGVPGSNIQGGNVPAGSGNTNVTPTVTEPAAPTVYTAPDGRIFNDLAQYNAYLEQTKQEEKRRQGQSAYDLLLSQFSQYGLGSLVEDVKKYIQQGLSQSELTLRLRTESQAYQKRFAANAQRIAKGLSALNEAEYIGLEDQYQNIMRQYGLPASYYAKGEFGVQAGFEKLLANDVSATELEDRVMTAQERLLSASPEIMGQLKGFYNISEGDILSYVLDPQNALTQIKRRVQAAEIGAGAFQAGLQTGVTRAEELAAAGVTKQQAQQGFQTVAEVAPRGGQLAEMYKQSPYTQQTAEAEVFGLAGSAEAARQRKRLTSLETAQFSGSAGAGAIARDRAGVL